ncbi:MAG: glycosyltransferase family 39 protein [Candidatus Omnitrophica bacterium]|nr:glycosyltransferase family 39 protein [Candidatus Omnitrophota bacterium]
MTLIVFIFSNPEWLILAAGIGLRLKHLLENRPLWLDEAYVAVGLISRSYSEIFANHEIFPEFARAPMLFEIIEKFMVDLLGNHEISLRLFPFICSIAALAAFAAVSRKILSRPAFLLALSFFALAEPLVYYAAELKQYSIDLLCAILLVDLARLVLKNNFQGRDLLILTLFGAAALWLSNAMIFMLAGIGGVFLISRPWTLGRKTLIFLSITMLVWLVSSGFLYFYSLRFMIGNTSITQTWKEGLCASPVFSWATLRWLGEVWAASFPKAAGLTWWWLMLPLFVVGIFSSWRKDRALTLLWFLPVLFVLFAALMGKYPFYGRVILFLMPGYYIFIASGIGELLSLPRVTSTRYLALLLTAFFFFQPVADAGYHFLHSRSKTDNRGVMDFVARNYRPGDFIYLSTSAQPPFWYYAQQTGLSLRFPQPVVGESDGKLIRAFKVAKFALDAQEIQGHQCIFFMFEYNVFDKDGNFRSNMGMQQENGKIGVVPVGFPYHFPATGRTWLILSSPGPEESLSNDVILASFDLSAKRLKTFESLNAGAFLFDVH